MKSDNESTWDYFGEELKRKDQEPSLGIVGKMEKKR